MNFWRHYFIAVRGEPMRTFSASRCNQSRPPADLGHCLRGRTIVGGGAALLNPLKRKTYLWACPVCGTPRGLATGFFGAGGTRRRKRASFASFSSLCVSLRFHVFVFSSFFSFLFPPLCLFTLFAVLHCGSRVGW